MGESENKKVITKEDINYMSNLEKELSQIVELDKQNWTHFYIVLKKIQENSIWRSSGSNSFTSWVKNFCVKNKIHESVVWNRKKAGEVYQKYEKIMEEKGLKVSPINELKIAPDSLVLIDKISKGNMDIALDLTDKAVNKEITRDDLREAYKLSKSPSRIKSKENIVSEKTKEMKSNSVKVDKDSLKSQINEEVKRADITAAMIVSALSSFSWLGVEKKNQRFVSWAEQQKYRTYSEFPVYTGTTKKSRQIDLLVAENLTTELNQHIHLHGIEIKVNKYDLINDMKYSEYAEFTDYTWVAIPEELLELAEETKFDQCGIIVVKDNIAKVHTQAKKMNPLMREETLMRLAVRLM